MPLVDHVTDMLRLNKTLSLLDVSPTYFIHDFWEDFGDPRVAQFPLMSGGPWKVAVISLLYVYFVRFLGPQLMKGRKPFDLRPLMLLHNSFLIGVNGCGFFVGLWVLEMGTLTWQCGKTPGPEGPTTLKQTFHIYLGYIYMLTKIVDFADTIFFVLRKKYHQASFLHVFHHAIMPVMVTVGLKISPIGYAGFMPLVNLPIHFFMYSYYAMACAGEGMRRHLWWKKYITQLQMVQFILIFIHAVKALLVPDCMHFIMAFAEGVHSLLFFYMFFSFYRRVYWNNNNNAVTNGSAPNKKSQ